MRKQWLETGPRGGCVESCPSKKVARQRISIVSSFVGTFGWSRALEEYVWAASGGLGKAWFAWVCIRFLWGEHFKGDWTFRLPKNRFEGEGCDRFLEAVIPGGYLKGGRGPSPRLSSGAPLRAFWDPKTVESRLSANCGIHDPDNVDGKSPSWRGGRLGEI